MWLKAKPLGVWQNQSWAVMGCMVVSEWVTVFTLLLMLLLHYPSRLTSPCDKHFERCCQ